MARDLSELVAALDLDEKADLLAGVDLWSTKAIPRLGIPSVRVTDGPNGARGPGLPAGFSSERSVTSLCVPCAASLGATWDPDLVERVGAVLGEETRDKACRVLLAPTVNLHRSPMGGRNFESYSEDPLLSGRLAAAFVRGAQSQGVACTVKHFVGNEAETDRQVADTIVDQRTLRELYLLPFELAVTEGGALGIMTAYNRVNGRYVGEDECLLAGVLRDDWGFDGFVISDWFAAVDSEHSIIAGLDLEMPGPGRAYGTALATAVREVRVDPADIDSAILRLLGVFDRLGALDDDPAVEPASTGDRPEQRAIAREAATLGTVLLKNDGVLPLAAQKLRRVAVIGPNAASPVIMGGGSASLTTMPVRSLLDALQERLGPDVEVVHEQGTDISLTTPEVPTDWLMADGEPGMTVECLAADGPDGDVVHRERVESGAVLWGGNRPLDGPFSFHARAELTVPHAGRWVLSLAQIEPAQLLIDGVVVLDGHDHPLLPGDDLLGFAKREITTVGELIPERPVSIEVRSTASTSSLLSGVKVGLRPALATDTMDRAVALAADADAVIVVVGTDGNWEREGRDRASLALPGEQDDLVERVVAVAPDAVIVLNTGAPVATPWVDDASALLQVWFGGQEMADALVDVLVGDRDPGGRLPTTMPRHLRDTPTWGSFPPIDGRSSYAEGILVGYRWYESREIDVPFPFGHGLSYTTFSIGAPSLSSSTIEPDGGLAVRVPVTNTGDRAGREVVQLYVAPLAPTVFRPVKELKAFAPVTLEPGETTTVELALDGRAFAHWVEPDPARDEAITRLTTRVPWEQLSAMSADHGWVVDAGRYELHIGRSSADITHVVAVDVPKGGPVPT